MSISKSNQIKFYLYGTFHTLKATQSASKTDTETYRHTDTSTHTRMHTCTQNYTSSDPLPLFERDMAPRPKARKKPPLWADRTEKASGPRLQGALPQRQPRPGQTRGPTTKVQSPPATRARAVHRTAPPSVDQKQHPAHWS